MTAAFPTIPLREPRVESTAPSLDGLAFSANRVALPADRKEADPTDPADEQGHQKEVVLAVVREYTRALERLDVHATKAVYPSVDARRLRESFEVVEAQRFQLGSCGVSFSSSGHDANAWCLGNSTYRPKLVRESSDTRIGCGSSTWGGVGWERMADSQGAGSVDGERTVRPLMPYCCLSHGSIQPTLGRQLSTTRRTASIHVPVKGGDRLLVANQAIASPETRLQYRIERLLGKGGFGQVYLRRAARALGARARDRLHQGERAASTAGCARRTSASCSTAIRARSASSTRSR